MLRTVDEITQRLVSRYSPDRIILFGSAKHDVDLCIIKDSDKSPMERRIEVERLLFDRAVPMDIVVYTPAEFRYLFSIGSPFVEEILEKGRLLYMRKATASWLKETEEELDSARILLEHGKFRGACYHSQQSVEKGLKALILEKGKRPERTHDIVELFHTVQGLGWSADIPPDDAIFLNSIYRGRYPTDEGLLPQGEPTREEAETAVSIAHGFVEGLKKTLA